MSGVINEFEKLSIERKELQQRGEVPNWFTTQGYILFKRKYAWNNETVKGAFNRISKTLAKHMLGNEKEAEQTFFNLLWSGKLAPSTPVYCNTGTTRGLPVSCAGSYIGDSVSEFYEGYAEIAMLSKLGFGTASYLGDIRERGASVSSGGNADGIVPVFDSCVDVMTKISQGSNRRGQWAGYLPVSHPDFWELCGYLQKNPGDANVGWVFTDNDIELLKTSDKELVKRWNKILYLRARTGKGYFWKPDTANKLTTSAIKNSRIPIVTSQLCNEIALPCDNEHTFTCVLSSLNLTLWDEITDEDIQWSVYFLDCVCEEFLGQAKKYKELSKAVRFTEKARALGLGTLGFHSLLQSKMIPFESFEAHMLNTQIFSRIKQQAEVGSKNIATLFGEPEWCKGTGMRNATLMAVAPNMSSAVLCGSVSQGIEPWVSNTFLQQSAGGEFVRINPALVELLKQKGVYTQEMLDDINNNHQGSVQHLECLSEKEKMVFKTAFEIDQRAILRLASTRQRYIDQGQSLNLFFDADEEEEYVAEIHKEALLDPFLKGLYYLRSERGVVASKGECVACEG